MVDVSAASGYEFCCCQHSPISDHEVISLVVRVSVVIRDHHLVLTHLYVRTWAHNLRGELIVPRSYQEGRPRDWEAGTIVELRDDKEVC